MFRVASEMKCNFNQACVAYQTIKDKMKFFPRLGVFSMSIGDAFERWSSVGGGNCNGISQAPTFKSVLLNFKILHYHTTSISTPSFFFYAFGRLLHKYTHMGSVTQDSWFVIWTVVSDICFTCAGWHETFTMCQEPVSLISWHTEINYLGKDPMMLFRLLLIKQKASMISTRVSFQTYNAT